jgi:hypothetical protein
MPVAGFLNSGSASALEHLVQAIAPKADIRSQRDIGRFGHSQQSAPQQDAH